MNFSDHVSGWPPVTPELELLIQLKYGAPQATPEYVNSLPDAVVEMAYREIMPQGVAWRNTIQTQRDLLESCIQSCDSAALAALKQSLYRYHTLVN